VDYNKNVNFIDMINRSYFYNQYINISVCVMNSFTLKLKIFANKKCVYFDVCLGKINTLSFL
jgi:hypothetical protein